MQCAICTYATNAALVAFLEKNLTAEAQRSQRSQRFFLCVLMLDSEFVWLTESYAAALLRWSTVMRCVVRTALRMSRPREVRT